MAHEPTATYLELRESNADGDVSAGLSHSSEGLVLLHVLELAASGEPRGAVTVVHDIGGHGGRYVALAEELGARDLAVALPDLRGHGRSEGERGHSAGIKEVLRDLGDVQDHLAYRLPEANRALVGHGLGAVWCTAFAAERPGEVAALVLAAPVFAPRFELPEPKKGLMGMFKKVGPTSPGRIGWNTAGTGDELVHDVITLRAGEQAVQAAQSYGPRLAELDVPVLVVAGSDDPLAKPADVEAVCGGAVEVRVFEGKGHDLLVGDAGADARAAVAEWLGAQLG